MAETKKPTKDGPVKAYDMPRQIEETTGNQSLRKKGCECEESASQRSNKMNRTFTKDNQKSLLSGRLRKIKAEYFPNKKSCPSGLCGGYTNKEQSFNLYPLKRGRSAQKDTRKDYSITPYSKVGRPAS